jgi:hypothetical protein
VSISGKAIVTDGFDRGGTFGAQGDQRVSVGVSAFAGPGEWVVRYDDVVSTAKIADPK